MCESVQAGAHSGWWSGPPKSGLEKSGLEYVGVIVLVALIIAAIVGSEVDTAIADGLTNTVDEILGGE